MSSACLVCRLPDRLLISRSTRLDYFRAGEENLDFLESLRTSSQINVITTRHEASATFMAATYGRLTGKVSPRKDQFVVSRFYLC